MFLEWNISQSGFIKYLSIIFLVLSMATLSACPKQGPTKKTEKPPLRTSETLEKGFPDRPEIKAELENIKARLKADPNDSIAFKNLGELYLKVGWYDEAVEALISSVAANPNDPQAQFLLGKSLFEVGDYASALDRLNSVLPQYKDLTEVRLTLGKVHSAMNNPSRAIQHFEDALKPDDMLSEAYLELGIIDYYASSYKPALYNFSRAAFSDMKAKEPPLFYMLALIASGDTTKVEKHKKEMKAFFSRDKEMMRILALLAGEIDEKTAFKEAGGEEELCRLNFYYGALKTARGENDRAGLYFLACSTITHKGMIEARAARMERRKL